MTWSASANGPLATCPPGAAFAAAANRPQDSTSVNLKLLLFISCILQEPTVAPPGRMALPMRAEALAAR